MEFSYRGLAFIVPASVYPPAEDSFMLAEAAASLQGDVLEIGCGCGIASIICAKTGRTSVLGADINPAAVECASENAKLNKTNAEFIVSDLFSRVPKKRFDAVLFNPPYLPTGRAERLSGPLNAAFDGGPDGRLVLDRFLAEFHNYLKPDGALFLVQSSLNGLEATAAKLGSIGYSSAVVARQYFFFEMLCLLRCTKK